MSDPLAAYLAGCGPDVRERNRHLLPAAPAPAPPRVPRVAVAAVDARALTPEAPEYARDHAPPPRAVEFVVPGRAQPKERRIGEGRAARTPPRTRAFEAMCRGAAALAMRGAPPLAGPVRVTLVFHLRRPKGEPPGLWADKGPDADNMLKSVLDSLNGVAIGDDRQVAELKASKIWTDGNPRTAVRVEPLERTW